MLATRGRRRKKRRPLAAYDRSGIWYGIMPRRTKKRKGEPELGPAVADWMTRESDHKADKRTESRSLALRSQHIPIALTAIVELGRAHSLLTALETVNELM